MTESEGLRVTEGVVDEALMVEPTESESKETLDAFCDAMLAIAREAEESPDVVRAAPTRAPLRRLDEATAARTSGVDSQ